MDTNLWAALIGISAGALGYWLTTFVMQPILRYREIRNKVLMDFIYFVQVANAEGLNDEMQRLYRERVLSNRKTSAQLSAAVLDLPWWYLRYLQTRGVKPDEAARNLIGYSNTTEYDLADKIQKAIRKNLGLPRIDESY